MDKPILFTPITQERVWGGRDLERKLGRTLPPGKVIGESWEIVDRPEAQSVVASGEFAGQTLRSLVENRTAWLLGPAGDPARPFPILIKWLDCQERLSLQVHPPAEVAPLLKGEPKTENWYVAGAEPGAGLIVGLKEGVTREAFAQALEEEKLEELVHRFPVEPGHSILVESGRLHAIDGGNLILEIQQNSDTTYRVYDWGRVGLDGQPRQLHVEQSMRSIDFDDFEPSPLPPAQEDRVLAECREFRIREKHLAAGETLALAAGEDARLVSLVRGALVINGEEIPPAANLLLPYAGAFTLEAKEPSVILLTDRFLGRG